MNESNIPQMNNEFLFKHFGWYLPSPRHAYMCRSGSWLNNFTTQQKRNSAVYQEVWRFIGAL